MFKIKSGTWGWLQASDVKIVDGLVKMVDVVKDGKPLYPECWIPVGDVKLIVPPSV